MSPTTARNLIDRSHAVCIIGAGPGGLSAARALKAQGLDYDRFERHSDLGGLWDTGNAGSSIYDSTQLKRPADTPARHQSNAPTTQGMAPAGATFG